MYVLFEKKKSQNQIYLSVVSFSHKYNLRLIMVLGDKICKGGLGTDGNGR